jgi:phosphoglycolate phosphatase
VIRLVLFDIDGTLIRTGGAGARAFERTFATAFHIPEATAGLQFAGRTDTSLARECFKQHNIPDTAENLERFFTHYVFWLQEFLQTLEGEPCQGAHEWIAALHSLPSPPLLGLLTGNIRLGAEIKLRHYQLWDPFVTGAFGDDNEDRNCLAALALERGQRLLEEEIEGTNVLVIGDTPLDIACARSIGANVLAVATGGYSRAQLANFQPTWIADDLTQVSALELLGA